MKKQLLTTTALVAVGVVAAAGAAQAQKKMKKPFITVNGYHEQVIGSTVWLDGNQAGVSPSLLDQHTESEVHFNGHAALDNGIKIRAHWELEGNSQGAGDTIDEVYMIIRGSFGQLTLGSEDNAGHLMTIGYGGSWATGVGQNLTFDVTDWIPPPPGFSHGGTASFSSRLDGDGDAEKITYYSPRFAGAQIGVSYIPTVSEDANGFSANTNTTNHDGIAVGANFTQKFGSMGVGLAAGMLRMARPDAVGTTADPMMMWNIAGRVDFGPFRVAATYKKSNSHSTAPALDRTGQNIDLGIRYSMGANSVSATAISGRTEGAPGGGNDTKIVSMLSFARNMGPGVKWGANVIYGRFKDEANEVVSKGLALTTSLRLSF